MHAYRRIRAVAVWLVFGEDEAPAPVVMNHHITINTTMRSDQDLHDLTGVVREQFDQLKRYEQRLIRGR